MSVTADVGSLIDYWNQAGLFEHERQSERRGRISAAPMRSAIIVPGIKQDWIRKSPKYGADGVFVDLEDAVQGGDKASAREIVGREITPLSKEVRVVGVRVNAGSDLLADDLAAVVRPGIRVINLPKVASPDIVRHVDRLLSYYEGAAGVPHGTVAINPILETAEGVRNAYEIATASDRVEYMGGLISPQGDTATALRINVTADGLESLYLRSKLIVDGRAAGLNYPMTGVVIDLNPDQVTVAKFARDNRDLGYTGMFVIHPSHVPVANEVFGPSAVEIERSIKVLAALRDAVESHEGAVRGPSGEGMVDLAMARFALQLLTDARALGLMNEE